MTNGAYEKEAKGIRVLPGQWRPHYPFEQIAWISPPWPSQDYLWLDFPEAIFTLTDLLYLSHVNPDYPVLFPNLPAVPWNRSGNGLSFTRVLPNGVQFGGSVWAKSESIVALELFIDNGSEETLKGIRLQACVYLRAIKEFADFSVTNKFVHVDGAGWVDFERAKSFIGAGRYRLGFRGEGTAVADLPLLATISNLAPRLVAMTWYEDSASLMSNPKHPCMHVDPIFPDLGPQERHRISGELLFFEGSLTQFDNWFRQHQP